MLYHPPRGDGIGGRRRHAWGCGHMLEVLGVDRWGEEAYLALIDGNALSPDEIVAATTIDRNVLSGVLQRLEDRGLICRVPGRPVKYAALPPDNAIEVLLLA